jgi:hypothetical protein
MKTESSGLIYLRILDADPNESNLDSSRGGVPVGYRQPFPYSNPVKIRSLSGAKIRHREGLRTIPALALDERNLSSAIVLPCSHP